MALSNVTYAILQLLIYDAIFIAVLIAVVATLQGTKQAAFAVMKRNFLAYFSNPTGYVFLCIFVFLTSLAAFWPYEFFNQNLATLDQLNYWYPLIMLVFIPAITMSIWAEERRQGTDELLLTLPADDFDIVIGKYMSAAAIFTSSLLFSQISTFLTLGVLTEGMLDTGLVFTTYLGYWFVGLTMIAIGMIASFLTGNLTVGFVLGSLFNAPLAFASLADSLSTTQATARWIAASGIARSFDDFGRGVVSSSSVVYFCFVITVALYICMVLIGRRHWTGGKDGNTMAWHYIARTLALIAVTGAAVILVRSWDFVRYDNTEGKVSSLAPATKKLLRELDTPEPIVIDAFISSDIPELYARTRYELVTLLKEFQSEAAKKDREIQVNLYEDIDLFSEEAALAAERFGIEPVTQLVREKGTPQQKKIILGAAFKCGLEKVIVPIFQYGIPVEYELVRSINTVASGSRKRIGIVTTDARILGGTYVMNGQRMQFPRHILMDELAKQYDIEAVDLNAPVSPDMYSALIAVQPSTLPPDRFDRLIATIESGVPVAIFEDPVPYQARGYITPTGMPKQSNFGGIIPKGDIQKLWDALDLEVPGTSLMPGVYAPDIVWHAYNPYRNFPDWNEFFVIVDKDAPGSEPGQALNDDSLITARMQQVLALFSGSVSAKAESKFKHTPVLNTGTASGLWPADQFDAVMRNPEQFQQRAAATQTNAPITIAMTVESPKSEQSDDGSEEKTQDNDGVKVVYVCDTDMMIPDFLSIRANPNQVNDTKFRFQNVTFLLNCVDWLAGEHDFIDVRKHEPEFRTLRMIDAVRDQALQDIQDRSAAFKTAYEIVEREAEEDKDKRLEPVRTKATKLEADFKAGKISRDELQAFEVRVRTQEARENQKLQTLLIREARERDGNIRKIESEAAKQVTDIQRDVKAAAVGLPCIPPLVVGVIVFASRRLRERENITKSRLK